MSFHPVLWAGIACLFSDAAPALVGQSPIAAYSVLGPPASPGQTARTERLRAILVEGWKVTPEEAGQLETELSHDPENLPVRVRLLSYYTQFLLNEPRVRHVLWLIENHPDSEVFRDAYMLAQFRNDAAGYADAKRLWQRQAIRFATNSKVLSNAAMALADERVPCQFSSH